jgi:hypothetical protein
MSETKIIPKNEGKARQRRARRVGMSSGVRSVMSKHKSQRNRGRRIKSGHRRKKRKTITMPPVLVRGDLGSMTGMASETPKRHSPRRRFDIALGVQGAEVRLPSLPVLHFSWRIASGILVILMTICIFNLWNSPAFRVESIEFNGLERLTAGDINTVLGIVGESVFIVSPNTIEDDLYSAFSELASVQVKVDVPANLVIEIVEREPVVALVMDGREIWVDTEGITFSPRGNPGSLVVVEAQSNPPTVRANTEVEDIAEEIDMVIEPAFVSAITTLGGGLPEDLILIYDGDHGLGWRDPAGWQVYLGLDTDDVAMKLDVYKALVDKLVSEEIHPAMISVEYVHAPYYRMER